MGRTLSDQEVLIFRHTRSILGSATGSVDVYRAASELAAQVPELDQEDIATSIAIHVIAAGRNVVWQSLQADVRLTDDLHEFEADIGAPPDGAGGDTVIDRLRHARAE